MNDNNELMGRDEINQLADENSAAVGIVNEVWSKHYEQVMLVDKSVTDAMQATHVSNSFSKSKWPSKCLRIKFEDKDFFEIVMCKGHQADLIQHAWEFASTVGDDVAMKILAGLSVSWGNDKKGVPVWFDDVVTYTIYTPYGKIFGNLPSESGEEELRYQIQRFVDAAGYCKEMVYVTNTTLMALKVINYSAIPYFAPSKIDRGNKKVMKEVKKKYKINTKQSLYRVVYLPKVIREYQEKNGQKKSSPLKNGRVGHLRTLHSDYFVNKQGQDILIPPIPDSQGRYPKIIYKVKKHKEAA